MPRSVLQVVAVILAACAVGGFVMGLQGAPHRARLPGEGANGASLEATDARPVGDLFDVPPPPLPEPEVVEEEKPDETAAAEAAPAPAAPTDAAQPSPKAAEEDHVGDLLQAPPPQPEQPPY